MMRTHKINTLETNFGRLIKLFSEREKCILNVGEIYISEMMPGHINAWKLNQKQSQNLCIIGGACWVVTATFDEDNSTYKFTELLCTEEQPVFVNKKIHRFLPLV